jgi:tetratricopeptide (TPR) repeat protein
MAQNQHAPESALEIDRLATQLAKDPHSKVFMPLAEEYGKVGMWQEAAGVLEDGLKLYPGFITAMVALGRAYDHMGQATKAKAILEESVKLSPENLRAHRTLIKIYQSQGLSESALQSCAVILAVNPRDEEALSVQSALGGPLKHKKEPAAPAEPTVSILRMRTPSDLPASMTPEPEIASTAPFAAATKSMDTALPTHDQTGEQFAGPGLGPQAVETVVTPPPPPYAEIVTRLEFWLRNIEARRHDHAPANEPHHKVS